MFFDSAKFWCCGLGVWPGNSFGFQWGSELSSCDGRGRMADLMGELKKRRRIATAARNERKKTGVRVPATRIDRCIVAWAVRVDSSEQSRVPLEFSERRQ